MEQEYSTDEVMEQLIGHIYDLVEYWNKVPQQDTKEKLAGLAFSILSTLDGSSLALPCFIVAPDPHPEDKQYHQSQGENWYPENNELPGAPGVELQIQGNLGGCLHDAFSAHERRNE